MNVLCNWVFAAYEHAGRALAKAVMGQVANAQVLLTDDSGLPVQDGSDGRPAPGRLWVFTDQQQAFFAFSRTNKGHNPAEVLAELHASGVLVADGGSEYNLTCERLQLERAGSWSHLRRYFHEAALVEPAAAALPAICDLFLTERQLTDLFELWRVCASVCGHVPSSGDCLTEGPSGGGKVTSLPKHLNVVPVYLCVPGGERHPLGHRLGDQQAIERILVEHRQLGCA